MLQLVHLFLLRNRWKSLGKVCQNALRYEIVISRVDVFRSISCLRFRFHCPNWLGSPLLEISYLCMSYLLRLKDLCTILMINSAFYTVHLKFYGMYDLQYCATKRFVFEIPARQSDFPVHCGNILLTDMVNIMNPKYFMILKYSCPS